MRNLKTGQKFEPRLPNVKSGTSIVQLPVFFIHCGKLHRAETRESGCAPAFPLAAIRLPGGDAEKELPAQSTRRKGALLRQVKAAAVLSPPELLVTMAICAWMTFLATLRGSAW